MRRLFALSSLVLLIATACVPRVLLVSAAAALVQQASGGSATGANFTVTLPANVTAGDTLIAFLSTPRATPSGGGVTWVLPQETAKIWYGSNSSGGAGTATITVSCLNSTECSGGMVAAIAEFSGVKTGPVPPGTNYTLISNTAVAPASFIPFSPHAPGNLKLPDSPVSVDATNTTRLQTYVNNCPACGGTFVTPAADFISGCVAPCRGAGGGSNDVLWVASSTDPLVSANCTTINTRFGCKYDGGLSPNLPSLPSFRIPANERPSCLDEADCGDNEHHVIQPNGDYVEILDCAATLSYTTGDWATGDILGDASPTSRCVQDSTAGAVVENLVTRYGININVSTGPASMANGALYNEVVPAGATIKHTLEFRVTCVTGFIYPDSANAGLCTGTEAGLGIPSGTRFQLTLTLSQIDALIPGTFPAWLKPFLYALHTYGAFVFDTSGDPTTARNFSTNRGPKLEYPFNLIRNGAVNPWIAWYQSNGGTEVTAGSGGRYWRIDQNLFGPVVNNLQVVAECYSHGTCSDSILPDPVDTLVLQASGTSATATANSLTTRTDLTALVVGVTNAATTIGAPTGGFTALTQVAAQGSSGTLAPVYQAVTALGTYGTSATLGASVAWTADMAALKSLPVVAAPETGGGGKSHTGWPISLFGFYIEPACEEIVGVAVCW